MTGSESLRFAFQFPYRKFYSTMNVKALTDVQIDIKDLKKISPFFTCRSASLCFGILAPTSSRHQHFTRKIAKSLKFPKFQSYISFLKMKVFKIFYHPIY